ncbi:MipA/OmpV family protein [Sandarakinorhabdus sp. AAP62]|uniref:MipA/OmpV family protein n=1 Tax=Sandarakinorhabdus sp. AAP62 TaxID=1248916 RepID=UPI000308D111|nr:MipA/OmpV family protein [Sandarakinorhabdus sp. AAP62]
MIRPAAALILITAAPALAQQGPAPGVPTTVQGAAAMRPPAPKAWTLGLGIAPIYAPVWQGSRDYGLSIFPDLRLNYKDEVFLSVPDGLGWNAINQDGWKIGPLAKLRFGRQENSGGSPFLVTRGSTALRGMGDVDLAGEFGGFAQKSLAGGKLRLRAEVRQGTGGHDGLIADTIIGWSDRKQDFSLLWNLSLRATWADSDYSNIYFGVTPGQSFATGLPSFRTGSGLISAGVSGALTRPLGRFGKNGALTLLAGYDRLGDVAADSPLIRLRGQRDQLSVGLSYGVRFGWN